MDVGQLLKITGRITAIPDAPFGDIPPNYGGRFKRPPVLRPLTALLILRQLLLMHLLAQAAMDIHRGVKLCQNLVCKIRCLLLHSVDVSFITFLTIVTLEAKESTHSHNGVFHQPNPPHLRPSHRLLQRNHQK